MKKIKISLIILNWNGKDLLKTCLNSVKNQTIMPYETIVVDNGSTDGSAEFVKRNFSFVKIIELKENMGFAKANNIGFDNAKGDYSFILNNDTELDKKCIENIIKKINNETDNNIGMYSLKMLYFHQNNIDSLGLTANKIGLSKDLKHEKELKKLIGPCGGAAIYKREMLNDVKNENGYFDSRYFIYFEDADLAWRAKNKGWKCELIDNAVVHHLHEATTKRVRDPFLYLFIRNRILSFLKNSKPLIITILPFIVLQIIVLAKYFLKGKTNLALNAVIDGFKNKIIDPKEIFKRYS